MKTIHSIMEPHLRCSNLWQVCAHYIIYVVIKNLYCLKRFHIISLLSRIVYWKSICFDITCKLQLDGRPMSGDIGRGATRESIAFALRLASMEDRPDGLYR